MGLPVLLVVGLLLAAPHGGASVRAPSRQKLLPLGSRPVAFEGSAMLGSYYMGVSGALQKCGVIRKESTIVGGLSGGSYIAIASILGVAPEDQLKFFTDAVAELNTRYNRVQQAGLLNGHLNSVLQIALDKYLPDDAATRLSGHLRLAMSQLNSQQKNFNNSASWVVNRFTSKHDVMMAMLGSNYIPCQSGSNTFALYRGQPVIDGGYGNGFSQLCPKGSLVNCVKIATWIVSGNKANLTCDESKCDCKTVTQDRLQVLTQKYANPGTPDSWPIYDVQQRCPEGAWHSNGSSQGDTYPDVDPYPLPDWVPQGLDLGPEGPDIHPGKYNPLPMWNGERLLACEWKAWAMHPPNNTSFMLEAFNLGAMDGASYCAEQNMTTSP